MPDDDSGFPALSAPARRALANAGYTRLEQLVTLSRRELDAMHGIGPTAVTALRAALAERGLTLRDG
jgi:hypothetical protein